MSDIKCPFCDHELREVYCNGICMGLVCKNVSCLRTKSTLGNKAIWQKLARLEKKIKKQHEFITKLYLNGNITDEQLERYKKSLKQKD